MILSTQHYNSTVTSFFFFKIHPLWEKLYLKNLKFTILILKTFREIKYHKPLSQTVKRHLL